MFFLPIITYIIIHTQFFFFQETSSLGWANLQLFDFNDRLLNEKVSLNLWPLPQGMDELLNYVGQIS